MLAYSFSVSKFRFSKNLSNFLACFHNNNVITKHSELLLHLSVHA